MAVSPRLSFKGYRIGQALYRNKDFIKSIIAILGTVNIAMGVSGIDWAVIAWSLGGAVLTLCIKLLSDAVDYYFSEVQL
jgi:hypothetical protein